MAVGFSAMTVNSPKCPILSCGRQKYLYSPGTVKVLTNVRPARTAPESKGSTPAGTWALPGKRASAWLNVTVCIPIVLLVHVTSVPTRMAVCFGANAIPGMSIRNVGACANADAAIVVEASKQLAIRLRMLE